MQYGLLGQKLVHSYSPQIHKSLGSYPYELVELEPAELSSFFREKSFQGLNVTIPYKKTVIPYCDTLTDTAKALGAVNTIVRRKDGSLLGHNTDYYGFLSLIHRSKLKVENEKVLVLGSGGASVTVQAALKTLGARVTVISRNGENNYHNLFLHQDASVIVNATPVGMYPNTGIPPVNVDSFPKLKGVIDLVYNPARTKLILDAEAHGIPAVNGLWMLVAQAKESAQYFLGHFIDDGEVENIYNHLNSESQNLVLIGMPGCGKTSIGAKLAKATGREFKDSDMEIEKRYQISIPRFIQEHGEEEFRKIESTVLSELGKRSGIVISTGGGCVTQEKNYAYLHQNSRIIWIQRDLECLVTSGRPLSCSGSLQELYRIRKPLYQSFSDAEISNQGSIEDAVKEIMNMEKCNENISD